MDEEEADGDSNQYSIGNEGNIDETNGTAVLYACQGEDATEREKGILLNISASFDQIPIVIIDAEGHEENVLDHKNVVSRLCNNEKKSLTLKRTDNPKRCYDGVLKYGFYCPLSISKQMNQCGLSPVLFSWPFKKVLHIRTFIELNDDMCEKALAGSIIVNNKYNTAVLVNTVEVYGRKKINQFSPFAVYEQQ
ncbi:unnamed protein product [Rhizopus stolonifer]